MEKIYLTLESLEVFQLSKQLSSVCWNIYKTLDWKVIKDLKEQFIDSSDSVGANIAEGYGRFHYLDRIKFMYNARGSLLESKYWFDLLIDRKLLKDDSLLKDYLKIFNELKPKLNNFINSIYKNRSSHLTPNV
ncbi:four helix bundle protein [Candidatus Roizmanbacteria bacterium CG_4_8_14_3_um_filter_34_9]|uniref:Four helix bundle protein n=2 Tax=Candidatus Roizmaniibacteriota TaxID=1752723 RepID=A0A2M6YTD6_9BACT|nr:MAG: four helix bundle protein [Candidatus Roizmanbacteria bacterium CG07_land_8_20_14_0_80_34_15]PIW73113.1 MAG: four helix bundle protein [Candidatus Roizmanbacteria bacterium CG_4_8_14_3_um_filter_34_9]